MYHVIKSLRSNCMGDRPCELELLSDPSYLANGVEEINYEDPNLNISVPVLQLVVIMTMLLERSLFWPLIY